jgi:hypothetical protein
MNHFKFFSNNNSSIAYLTTNNYLTLRPAHAHSNNEFCMQFDDDEPFVFARGNNDLTITISPTADGNIVFNHNGRTFKLFARNAQNG